MNGNSTAISSLELTINEHSLLMSARVLHFRKEGRHKFERETNWTGQEKPRVDSVPSHFNHFN